jgi:hypothetical protein
MAAEFVDLQTRPLTCALQEFANGILMQTPSRYMSISTYRTEDRAFINSGLVEPLSERADRTCILTGSERQTHFSAGTLLVCLRFADTDYNTIG